MDAVSGCPDDYAELFEVYWPMMKKTVAHAGIAKEDVEDVTMEILTKFMEKGGLDHYDPNYIVDVGSHPEVAGPRRRPAKFGSMLRGFTSTYVLALRDKQKIKHHRETHRLDALVNPDEDTEFIDFLSLPEPQREVDTRAAITYSLNKTAALMRAKSTSRRNYEALCTYVVEETYVTARLPRRDALCSMLGVSTATMRSMLCDYQSTLAEVAQSADVYP